MSKKRSKPILVRSPVADAPAAPLNRVHAWWRRLLLGGFLIAVTLAAYYPVLSAGYDWDDNIHFRNNTFMRDWTGLKEMWLSPRQTANPIAYYPVTMSVFWVQCQIFGVARAAPFHGVSLALHIGNALLVWWVLRSLKLRWAWLAAVLFAIHPIQVETVAWVSEQKNLLSTMLSLLTVGSYWLFATNPRPTRWWAYGLALGLFLLAMLSKAVVLPLPVVILLLLWARCGRLAWRDVLPLAPLFLIGLAVAALFAWVNLGLHSQESDLAFTPVARLVIAGHAIWFYLRKLLWPLELLAIYPRWDTTAAAGEYLYPATVVAVLAGLAALRRWLGIRPLVAVAIFIVLLSPALGLLSFSYLRFSFVADHFVYMAALGVFVLLAEGLRTIWTRLAARLPAAAHWTGSIAPQLILATVLILIFAPLTWGQACLRQDMIAEWQYTVEHNPRSWMAHAMLAGAYVEANDYAQALDQARQSTDIRSNACALEVAAVALLRQGRAAEACLFYQRLIQENWATPFDYLWYGKQEAILGHEDRAVDAFAQCVRMDPAIDEAWDQLAACHLRQQQWNDAAVVARAALAHRETQASAHYNLAWALEHLGSVDGLDGAMAHYRRALELNPDLAVARLHLGLALEQRGHKAEALVQYQRTVAAQSDYLDAHKALAHILLEMGKTAEAALEQRRLEQLSQTTRPK